MLSLWRTGMNYAKVYARNWDAETKSLHEMKTLLQAQYERAIQDAQKKRQPKKRANFAPLPDGELKDIRDHFLGSALYKEIGRLEAEINQEKENHQKILYKLAPLVKAEPEQCMHMLKSSSSHGYSSQGYGATTYAKGVLVPYQDRLESLGFEVHIREVNYQPGRGTFGCTSATYELWANCPAWMFDAISRCLSMEDAVASWKRRAINPLVYNPYLGDWARL